MRLGSAVANRDCLAVATKQKALSFPLPLSLSHWTHQALGRRHGGVALGRRGEWCLPPKVLEADRVR